VVFLASDESLHITGMELFVGAGFRTTVAASLERPRRILASSGVAVARVLINFAHCRKRSSECLFLKRKRKPNQHLLRDLQDLAKKAGAKFHTELHIRKVILCVVAIRAQAPATGGHPLVKWP
jgi:hypothetical protein